MKKKLKFTKEAEDQINKIIQKDTNNKYFRIKKSYLTKIYQLSVLVLFVGALSLSWLWREVLWVVFAIYFALNFLQYKKIRK